MENLQDFMLLPGVAQRTVQTTIPNFQPQVRLNYQITPNSPRYGWAIYRIMFGEAMVPHQFSVILDREGGQILNAIISGQLIYNPFDTFSIGLRESQLNVIVANLRNVVGYFELNCLYLEITNRDSYEKIVARYGGQQL